VEGHGQFASKPSKLIAADVSSMRMMRLADKEREPFIRAVERASGRDEVRRAVHNVLLALQDAIDLRKPVCVSSGRCCRFDEFGHRLFVTTMEFAAFVHDLREIGYGLGTLQGSESNSAWSSCPFQQDKLCTVHHLRPFGCRVFFCDATSTEWQHGQYARFHAELKRLHVEL
jgi:hypothetical protein